jgi:hypothetical protein
MQGAVALGQRLAAGCFVTSYWANWEDSDDPRTVKISAKVYSAAATTRCIHFQLDWHQRARMSFAESFHKAHACIRWGPGKELSQVGAVHV